VNEPTNPKPEASIFELKHGYRKGCLLPTVTIVIGVTLCAYAVRHFCIDGTLMDKRNPPTDRDAYYDARRDYSDGNLESAASQAAKILSKQPNHAEANQLMARIELARGNRERALDHLRRSLDTSLDRAEVEKWIATLEASPSK
jgi:tetratricopeptide (TPR) repeat protein